MSTLHIDSVGRAILIDGQPVSVRLSRQEFDLLLYLYERTGQICTREEISGRIWGEVELGSSNLPKYDDHMLHALVHRVRTKLSRAGVDLNSYLSNIPGVGYRLDLNPHPGAAAATGFTTRAERSRRVLAATVGGAVAVVTLGLGALLLMGVGTGSGHTGGAAGTPASAPAVAATSPAASGLCGSDMISPAPGSTLPGAAVRFQWTAGCGMTKYDIWVGCSPQADDYFNPDDGNFLEATVSNLPTDGGPVFVMLTASNGTDAGTFQRNYSYTAAQTGNQGTTVYVPGTASWFDTGVDVATGQGIKIHACGQVPINSMMSPRAKPEGDPSCPGVWKYSLPAPDLPCWSLIGRVGEGTPFFVGQSLQTISQTTGRLYLQVNDDNLTDNSGGFRATIQSGG